MIDLKTIRYCRCAEDCPIHSEAGTERTEHSHARNALDAARYRWLRQPGNAERVVNLDGYDLDGVIDDALENPDAR